MPPRTIVPDVMMNPRVAKVDRAIRQLSDEKRDLICFVHLVPGKAMDKCKNYCSKYHIKQSEYYARLNWSYEAIGKRL